MKGSLSFSRVFLGVLLAHGALLLFFGIATTSSPPRPFRPIAVRTMAPPVVVLGGGKKGSTPAPPSVKKSKKASPQKKELLQEVAKGLQALEEKRSSPPRPQIALPSKIEWIPTLEKGTFEGEDYEEALLATLKGGLELPERGAVKMELVLDKGGALLSCKVLQTKSGKNAQFLLEELPKLSFPPLPQKDKIELIITFSNN